MPSSSESVDDAEETARLMRGLRHLGLRAESRRSVLNLWARTSPSGMFEGHLSALVAPDHLLKYGLTKRLVRATFKLLSDYRRKRVALSTREALAQSHYPTTSVYNGKRRSIINIGIAQWAAILTVFGAVLQRTLRSATPAD